MKDLVEYVTKVNQKIQEKPLPVHEHLNKAGAEGWELMMFRYSDFNKTFFYLKRVVDED